MRYIDMHCDTISAMGPADDLAHRPGHIDLDRLEQAGCAVQNFALFVGLEETDDPFATAVALADRFDAQMAAHSDRIVQVRSAQDIREVLASGRIGALLTLEEGEVCCGDIEKLRYFYDRGARMMALSWNYPNSLGHPNLYSSRIQPGMKPADFAYTPDTVNGLTETGRAFVLEMERLGMLVDVSHMSDAGFHDVAGLLKGPFVASHSNARAVCPWVRNLTDPMIRILADHGGVMGLNFCMDFINDQGRGGLIEAVVEHAQHIVKVGGLGVLGLGSDFDGIDTATELYDAAQLPRLADALVRSGFSEDAVEQIFFGNVMRVYEDVLK